jgi:amidase
MRIPANDYLQWDAVEMARLVRRGAVSGADLAETALARLDRLSALNAVADLAHPGDVPTSGPFAGVPFLIKELLAWPGLPWTMGSRMMAATPAPGLPAYAAKLQDAGLNVIGSTTSSEFGLLGSTESALRGVTRNPWRDGVSAGGSSGGSAVAVAAGIVPMAHGSDAGGSLRVPAALNGVFGFKPSNGRTAASVPEGPGLAALLVDHCMSRSVRDSAHLLAATERTGADAVHSPVGLVEGPVGGRLRIGVLGTTLLGTWPEAPISRELERTAAVCASLGHSVETFDGHAVDGAALSAAFFTAAAMTMTQMAAMFTPLLGRAPGADELEPFTLQLIDWAATLGPESPADAERAIGEASCAYLRLFETCDVVLTPTLARASWLIGHLAPDAGREALIRRTQEAVCYTPVHNAAGCPAMTVPLGSHDGLPVGMHFAAKPGADALLLSLAYELEDAQPWAAARPDLSWLERSAA